MILKKVDLSEVDVRSPSQFMRDLRPECYSDTQDKVGYSLKKEILEYHLESITQRNETHAFELFCRKLCERTICPNLRSHTGPDGGGDSKVDTETYPVASEIADSFLVGNADAGRERWAFAISAKEDWKSKVKDDVAKIVETARNYKKIFFITSRFARDKDRASIEDSLSKKYDIPVIIYDRSWIIQEIIDNNRKDLAYHYLGIGEEISDPFRLGANDYSRVRQLLEIEKDLADPSAFIGMKRQRVKEALIAAQLSRALEHPRLETDGRFLRAIRFADAGGSKHQQLEARYEQIWTAFWWFDDFLFLKENYEFFETLAINSEHASDLEFLCNLHQLLVNSIVHGYMTAEECNFQERQTRLIHVLERLLENKERPNNSLEAETLLLTIRMNQAMMECNQERLNTIWDGFSDVLDKANGLGEFKAGRLKRMIEVTGKLKENTHSYNRLVEKTAEFVAKREGQVNGAKILLERAKHLSLKDIFQILRLTGKAAVELNKAEYREQLIEALWLLMLAYRSAGLLWAARATCMTLAATIVIQGEEEGEIPTSFIPTMKMWAWIALELQHIPDFFYAIQLLNGALVTLSLTDESKTKINEDIIELEVAVGCLFLSTDESLLPKLSSVPDILGSLGLTTARSALLYKMGHLNILKDEKYFPSNESDEDINQFYSTWLNQPLSQQLQGSLILHENSQQSLSTHILGMTLDITVDGSFLSILIAETTLGFIDAFFATMIEQDNVIPHTERVKISLVIENLPIENPCLDLDSMSLTGILRWPSNLSPANTQQRTQVQDALFKLTTDLLGKTCVVQDGKSFVSTLFTNDGVHYRIALASAACVSYHRVLSQYVSRISDWDTQVENKYDLKLSAPVLTLSKIHKASQEAIKKDSTDKYPDVNDHRKVAVRSVFDMHAWDKAQWKGTAYGMFQLSHPPFLALTFENKDAGLSIFKRWRERFDKEDKEEEIYISIIRQIPGHNPHHYYVLISSNLKNLDNDTGKKTTIVSRHHLMQPSNSVNLDNFLLWYKKFRAFYLLPAFLGQHGKPELIRDLAIIKRSIRICSVSEIGMNDIESLVIRNKK